MKIETDHIEPRANDGNDDIENAIPVCFDCHAEIHSYNDRHPRGRKFTPDELRQHKALWLKQCDNLPMQLLDDQRVANTELGATQALIDEIEFNRAAARAGFEQRLNCPLRQEQFKRAIRSGSLSLLLPDIKDAIFNAYIAIGHARAMGQAAATKLGGGVTHSTSGTRSTDLVTAYRTCEQLLAMAHEQLLKFLGHEHGPEHNLPIQRIKGLEE